MGMTRLYGGVCTECVSRGGGGGQMTSSVKMPSEFSYCYISYLNIYNFF